MKKMKVLVTLLAMVSLLMTSCGTGNSIAKAERQAQVAQQVQTALENRHYTIAIDWMKPLGGMPRHVSSTYELKINGDQVDSYLPYVGEAYRVPYGGGKGLNFQGKIEDYTMTKATTNRLVIEFNVTNEEDAYHYRIDLFTNGKAIIDVIARDRDAISFDGEMIF
jgi:hypothetical protein